MFFLPIGTTRPRRRTPWVTYGLIGANVLVMGLGMNDPEALSGIAFVPAHPNPLAWFASTFLHGGIMHLAGNMLFLWLFGTVVEDELGPLLFLAFYFGGDVMATLLDWGVCAAFTPDSLVIPRIGASGAIAGIIGVSAVGFMRTKVRVFYLFGYFLIFRMGTAEVPIALFGGLWVLWEVWQGFVTTAVLAELGLPAGGVAHWAHVGGFLGGMGAALAMGLRAKVARDDLITGRAREEDTSGFFSEVGELERVVQRTPGDAAAWLALGHAHEVSGRLPRAAEAFGQALSLFLQQRQLPRAAETYAAMQKYAKPDSLPPEMLFDLACALEDTTHRAAAYHVFLLAAKAHTGQLLAETALIRAGELARRELAEPEKAAHAYRLLLADYPLSSWTGMAKEGLRTLHLPEKLPPPPTIPPFLRPDPDLRGIGEEK